MRKNLSELCGSGTARGSVSTVGRTACTTFVRWLNRKSQAVGSSSGRSAAVERAESEAGKGNGDGGRGAEPPALSASECEEDEDKSTEASDALSTGESSAGTGGSPERPETETGQAKVTDPAGKPERGAMVHPD